MRDYITVFAVFRGGKQISLWMTEAEKDEFLAHVDYDYVTRRQFHLAPSEPDYGLDSEMVSSCVITEANELAGGSA